MRTEVVDITLLKEADYNPRKDLQEGDREYAKLEKSIATFGYVEPIVWNKTTGTVVGGHQRLKILKKQKIKKVEVVVVELDERREKRLNLALNKIAGEWDFAKLKTLITWLDQQPGVDLELTGFDEDEVTGFIEGMEFVDPSAQAGGSDQKKMTIICATFARDDRGSMEKFIEFLKDAEIGYRVQE